MIMMVLTNFNLSSNFAPSPETSGLEMSRTRWPQRSQWRSTMNVRVTSLLTKRAKPAWDSKNMNSQRLQAFWREVLTGLPLLSSLFLDVHTRTQFTSLTTTLECGKNSRHLLWILTLRSVIHLERLAMLLASQRHLQVPLVSTCPKITLQKYTTRSRWSGSRRTQSTTSKTLHCGPSKTNSGYTSLTRAKTMCWLSIPTLPMQFTTLPPQLKLTQQTVIGQPHSPWQSVPLQELVIFGIVQKMFGKLMLAAATLVTT